MTPMPLARWSHNRHYHDYLLAQLPPDAQRALDVGCGSGEFARALAARGIDVDAVDRSLPMIEAAQAAGVPAAGGAGGGPRGGPGAGEIRYRHADLRTLTLPDSHYDVVCCIASLHHLPLEPTFRQLREALRPGGLLAVLGLYRASTPSDLALDAAALVADLPIRLWLTLANGPAAEHSPERAAMPVMDAATSLVEIRDAAARLLPGARLRRHLFFRYSLLWQRP